MTRKVHGEEISGIDIDDAARCGHWHGETDIIAIRFRCCGKWFPCFECHAAEAGHAAVVWPEAEFDQQAILCGNCGVRLTIREYMGCDAQCPACGAAFNPRCSHHYYLYFECVTDD